MDSMLVSLAADDASPALLAPCESSIATATFTSSTPSYMGQKGFDKDYALRDHLLLLLEDDPEMRMVIESGMSAAEWREQTEKDAFNAQRASARAKQKKAAAEAKLNPHPTTRPPPAKWKKKSYDGPNQRELLWSEASAEVQTCLGRPDQPKVKQRTERLGRPLTAQERAEQLQVMLHAREEQRLRDAYEAERRRLREQAQHGRVRRVGPVRPKASSARAGAGGDIAGTEEISATNQAHEATPPMGKQARSRLYAASARQSVSNAIGRLYA